MSTDRQIADKIVKSVGYKTTVLNPTDRAKVEAAKNGVRRPSPGAGLAQAAWELYLRDAPNLPSPPTPGQRSRTLFDQRYAYVRDPASGSMLEKLDALRAAGYRGVAVNVGDHDGIAWGAWRTAAMVRGLVPFPWARCYTVADVAALAAIAKAWSALGLIVNLEQNAGTPRWGMTGDQVAAALGTWTGQIGVSTEPYLPENFNWLPLILMGAVDLPQCSALEFPQYPPALVVARVSGPFGWPNPSPSFATYDSQGATPTRDMYAWPGVFGIYTVDDLSPAEIPEWV